MPAPRALALFLAALALSPAAVFAQDAPTDTATTETAPAEPAPEANPADDLALGVPADGSPRPGEPYVREEFGDWALACVRAEEGPDPCQLYQLLLDETGRSVAEIRMFPLNDGERAAGATIVAPLETLLTEGLTLAVDGNNARRYPFSFCNAAGCVARVGFTAEEVAEFKAGGAASLTLYPAAAPDQEVVLTISLMGFTSGFDSAAAEAQ